MSKLDHAYYITVILLNLIIIGAVIFYWIFI